MPFGLVYVVEVTIADASVTPKHVDEEGVQRTNAIGLWRFLKRLA